MPNVKDMSVDDLEHFIEQKFLEIFGDPDSGLKLNDKFKRNLKKRLGKPSKRYPHAEVLKKFG
jgi:hypothetical protein